MKQKRITLQQIADAADVSAASVSAVLNNKVGQYLRVSEKTQKKIKKIAAELNYRPNAAARMMQTNKTNQIAVFLPNKPEHETTTPMNYETVLGMNSIFQANNYLLVIVRLHDLLNSDEIGSRVFSEHAVDGAVMIGSVDDHEDELLTKLFPRCIWCDTSYWQEDSCIRRDEISAGYLSAKALIEAGHKQLVWVVPHKKDAGHYSFKERLTGVKKAISEHSGIELIEVVTPDIETSAKYMKLGYGLIAANFPMAETLVYATAKTDCALGIDYSLVCCDDMNMHITGPFKSLSRCRFNRYKMGKIAAQMLISKLNGEQPKSQKVIPELIPGNTIINNR